MTDIGGALLVLTLALPLALAAVVPLVRRPLGLLPWAAVPGLATALLVAPGDTIEIPMVVLGVNLGLDRLGATFLGFGSLLWLLAGIYARRYLAKGERLASFALFWLVTLAGTLGTFIAADVVTFYVSFSMMSLAAYGLVVHNRTASARRAGRVYIILAVCGEASLLAGIMLAAVNAGSTLIGDVTAALSASPWRDWTLAGLVIGFGIKAGLVPLHVWLPLAHPEAPTPASAALSGIIVKAGIIGLMRFLPLDGSAPGWGQALIGLGIVTAYYGIVAGLTQREAKTILAYSTLSQMGLVVAVLASGLAGPQGAPALNAAVLYASHEGLAKGALFLSVGIVAASGARSPRAVMAVTAILALAIAGLPLTGGALAKLAVKGPLGDGPAGLLVTVSAAGTAMLMLRFLVVIGRDGKGDPSARPLAALIVPWAALAGAALVVPWALYSPFAGEPVTYAFSAANLWTSLWPILVAVAAAIIVLWRWHGFRPILPAGDIVVLGESVAHRVAVSRPRLTEPIRRAIATFRLPPMLHFHLLDGIESAFARWTVSGPAILLVAVLIIIALAR